MKKMNYSHLVESSCWPFMGSVGVFYLFFGSGRLLESLDKSKIGNPIVPLVGAIMIIVVFFFWFNDILKENLSGFHNSYVSSTLRVGMMFFILSEMFFFFGFFWSYFHCIFNVSVVKKKVAWVWGITTQMVEMDVPLFNTVLLISSGVFLTWAHHEMLPSGDMKENRQSVEDFQSAFDCTLMLGMLFLVLQWMEFELKTFTIKWGIFGSTFYMLTGFHGLHVFVGVCILWVFYHRKKKKEFGGAKSKHFLAATWYWHFVDVVWVMLFVSLYPNCVSGFLSFLHMDIPVDPNYAPPPTWVILSAM